jgi:hypothetical protein
MTFIARIEALSSRFLSDRSHQLIVAPAIADVEHDAASDHRLSLAQGQLSVLVAFAGAAYQDLTADSSALRTAGLTLIPAFYYTFLIYLCQPQFAEHVAMNFGRLTIPGAIAALSIAPVLVCCWPDRTPRRAIQRDAVDA